MNARTGGVGPGTLRVLIADDHPAILAGFAALLGAAPDIDVVATAADGPDAVRLATMHRPDVVLTDVRMPGATGIDITPALREAGAKVLVISAFDLDAAVLGALGAGAEGYLTKSESPEAIVAAVRAVGRGDAVLSASATRAVVEALRGRGPRTDSAGGDDPSAGAGARVDGARVDGAAATLAAGAVVDLTRREEDVVRRVAPGATNQEIAAELFIEVSTVKSHLTHALAKLGLSSRVQAALWWRENRDDR